MDKILDHQRKLKIKRANAAGITELIKKHHQN
jgi:hypothetical protein